MLPRLARCTSAALRRRESRSNPWLPTTPPPRFWRQPLPANPPPLPPLLLTLQQPAAGLDHPGVCVVAYPGCVAAMSLCIYGTSDAPPTANDGPHSRAAAPALCSCRGGNLGRQQPRPAPPLSQRDLRLPLLASIQSWQVCACPFPSPHRQPPPHPPPTAPPTPTRLLPPLLRLQAPLRSFSPTEYGLCCGHLPVRHQLSLAQSPVEDGLLRARPIRRPTPRPYHIHGRHGVPVQHVDSTTASTRTSFCGRQPLFTCAVTSAVGFGFPRMTAPTASASATRSAADASARTGVARNSAKNVGKNKKAQAPRKPKQVVSGAAAATKALHDARPGVAFHAPDGGGAVGLPPSVPDAVPPHRVSMPTAHNKTVSSGTAASSSAAAAASARATVPPSATAAPPAAAEASAAVARPPSAVVVPTAAAVATAAAAELPLSSVSAPPAATAARASAAVPLSSESALTESAAASAEAKATEGTAANGDGTQVKQPLMSHPPRRQLVSFILEKGERPHLWVLQAHWGERQKADQGLGLQPRAMERQVHPATFVVVTQLQTQRVWAHCCECGRCVVFRRC